MPEQQVKEIWSVKLAEYPNMIEITTADGIRWFYYRDHNGILILGQPYVMCNSDYQVYTFVPLGPGHMPILINVKCINEHL